MGLDIKIDCYLRHMLFLSIVLKTINIQYSTCQFEFYSRATTVIGFLNYMFAILVVTPFLIGVQ